MARGDRFPQIRERDTDTKIGDWWRMTPEQRADYLADLKERVFELKTVFN